MLKNILFLYEKFINIRYCLYLNPFIFLVLCIVKTYCYTDYKGVYIYNNKYYFILPEQISFYQKGISEVKPLKNLDNNQNLKSKEDFEMINIAKFNSNAQTILLIKHYTYQTLNDNIKYTEEMPYLKGYPSEIFPYKYSSSSYIFFLGFVNEQNIITLYLYQKIIDLWSASPSLLKATLTIKNVGSENFSCQIMQSRSDGEVLTCFYQIINTKNIIASSFLIDKTNSKIENITALCNLTETNGANIIKSNVYEGRTKAFVCFINDENNCDCAIYNLLKNKWSNYKTYLNNCERKRSTFRFDYYEIENEYFLYCHESINKFSLVKFGNNFEIKRTEKIDMTERLSEFKKCYFLTLIYDVKNITAMFYCDNRYSQIKIDSPSSTLIKTPSTFINRLNSSLPKTFLFSSILSSTFPSTHSIIMPSTIIKQNLLSTEVTYLDLNKTSSLIQYSTINNIQTLSSSIIHTSINNKKPTIISSLIQSSLIENKSTLSSTEIEKEIKTSLINKSSNLVTSLIQTSTIVKNPIFKSTIIQTSLINKTPPIITSIIKTSTIVKNPFLDSTIIPTSLINKSPTFISSIIQTSSIDRTSILIIDTQTHEASVETTQIITASPIINDNQEVILEKSDKTKEQIIQNLDEVMENYDVGKIYEIFGDDYSIKISPINTRIYSNISTYINFSTCENILREKNGLSQSSILTVYQIEIVNLIENSLINNVEYAVFDENKDRLDLSVCENEKIEINYQIDSSKINKTKIDYYSDLGVDIFDIEDEFFNDICYSYSENDADIILIDRVNEIYQNYSVCESNCEYDKINLTENLVTCQCSIKTSADIKEKPFRLDAIIRNSFEDTNLAVVKCYNLVFSIKNKSKNIGF